MIQQRLDLWLQQLGITLSADALLVVLILLSISLGLWLGRLLARRSFSKSLDEQSAKFEQQQDAYDQQIDQLRDTFASLSQQALQSNNQSFLTLARETFGKLQIQAEHKLGEKEKNIASMVKPIQESLQQTDSQLKKLERDRVAAESRLHTQIESLVQSQQYLQTETRNLVTALRRPEVRGQWGEITLKRLAELAGMSEHCDFDEQVTTRNNDTNLRPDMVVHMPGERQLVVDVKAPLDAYLSAVETSDDQQREVFLQQHLKNVKDRVKELAMKKYWEQFERAPDFAVLFIPGDQFLSAALDQDKSLLEFAMQQRIILATPTSLVGLLRAIAYGWNQDNLNKNAEVVRQIGKDLHQRLGVLAEHISKLGKNLDSSVTQFNRLLGSYESNVLPGARKFSELGVETHKSVDQIKAIETPTRKLTKVAEKTAGEDQ